MQCNDGTTGVEDGSLNVLLEARGSLDTYDCYNMASALLQAALSQYPIHVCRWQHAEWSGEK